MHLLHKLNRSASTLAALMILACSPVHAAELPTGEDEHAPFNDGPPGQVVGYYSDGRLVDAFQLPPEGLGWIKVFLPRDRGWGTFDMVKLIEWVADQYHGLFPSGERIQIGDIAAREGGFISGHTSHQVGLDADVVFLRRNQLEQSPYWTEGFVETFVHENQVTENFDIPRNWELLKLIVSTKRINRLFVDAVIKRTFCKYSKLVGQYVSGTEVLRRMRPYTNHKDHVHVRLTCPTQSPQCQSQPEVDPGSGCDSIQPTDQPSKIGSYD